MAHLRGAREKALGRFLAPEQVRERIEYEEGWLAGLAMREGKNPAQEFYEVAKEWGYKPKGSEQPKEENKLARLAEGQKKSASLSATKGAGTQSDDNPSLESLSELYASKDPEDHAKADRMWNRMAKAGKLG